MASAVVSLSMARLSVGESFRSFEGLRGASIEESATSSFRPHHDPTFSPSPLPLGPQVQQSRIPMAMAATGKTMKRSKIILIKDMPELGKAGDLLQVKRGYFRNYLLPYQFAKPATPTILRAMKLAEDKRLAELKQIKDEAEIAARQLKTIGQFTVRRKVGKGNAIFGTVTSQDVADVVTAKSNRTVDKRDVDVPEIKEIGFYDVSIKLHPEVTVTVKINVTKGA
eukprot:TRINITY_DN23216_c0_g1_i1.p1 TRINITY_DN23216_c0_g1~~TRINITY_DN23216_c0_g1_i1.p1  ORF type:complete len:257 (-),score=41.86 TRINITY_DN23216_c0_g1_i1:295-969(-)